MCKEFNLKGITQTIIQILLRSLTIVKLHLMTPIFCLLHTCQPHMPSFLTIALQSTAREKTTAWGVIISLKMWHTKLTRGLNFLSSKRPVIRTKRAIWNLQCFLSTPFINPKCQFKKKIIKKHDAYSSQEITTFHI